MAGLGPALKLSKTDLVADLKALTADGSPILGRRFSARNVMVVGQIALSLMLLSAGGLFARGALKAAAANPGFSYDAAAARRDRSDAGAVRRSARARRSIATCSRACARCPASRPWAWRRPCRSAISTRAIRSSASADRRARSRRALVNATYRVIGADYFRALNLPMVRGREFTEAEETSPDGAARRDRRRAPRAPAVRRRRSARPDDPLHRASRRADQERRPADGNRRHRGADPRRAVRSRSAVRRSTSRGAATIAATCSCTSRAAQAGTEADLLAAIRREIRAYDPRAAGPAGDDDDGVPRSQPAAVGGARRRRAVPRVRPARAAARRRRALRREVRTSCRSARARSASAWRSARSRATCWGWC